MSKASRELSNCTKDDLSSNWQATTVATLPDGRMCDLCVLTEGCDEQVEFLEMDGRFLCSKCADLIVQPIDAAVLLREFEGSLNRAKTDEYDGILAFSGGRDSAVALKLLHDRGLKILAFTVDQGMKNEQTKRNIHEVIDFLKVDWLLLHASPENAFREMITQGRSVCGPACVRAWKRPAYELVARRYGARAIFTGGDTPKNGSCVTEGTPALIRVVAAHGIKRADLERIIGELPWTDPGVGPYDSDCLMASYGINNILNRNGGVAPSILINYLADRIRFGLLDRDEELERLKRIPVPSPAMRQQVEMFVGIQRTARH